MKLQNEDKVTVEFTKEQVIELILLLHHFVPEELYNTGIMKNLNNAADITGYGGKNDIITNR